MLRFCCSFGFDTTAININSPGLSHNERPPKALLRKALCDSRDPFCQGAVERHNLVSRQFFRILLHNAGQLVDIHWPCTHLSKARSTCSAECLAAHCIANLRDKVPQNPAYCNICNVHQYVMLYGLSFQEIHLMMNNKGLFLFLIFLSKAWRP